MALFIEGALKYIFLVLMIIVIIQANHGEVNNALCKAALIFGILAGIAGLVDAFFYPGISLYWLLNLIIILMAIFLKKTARYFAYYHNRKIEEAQEEYREWKKLHSRDNSREMYSDINYEDPEVRFNGSFNENRDV